jgi:hypothetical protein
MNYVKLFDDVHSPSYATIGGITIGNPYRVKVYRAATEAGDTLVGDAELLAVEIRGA